MAHRPILQPRWKLRLWPIPLSFYSAAIFYRYLLICRQQESQYELWLQACLAFGGTRGPFSTLLEHTPCIRIFLDGEEAIFMRWRLYPRQKSSCEMSHKETFRNSTLVEFGFIGKWLWIQFFFRDCAVGWLTDVLLVLFPWWIVWNTRRHHFRRVYLGQMAQWRCYSGFTILLFSFNSSRFLNVSLLRLDCNILRANWQFSELWTYFYFPWPIAWSNQRLFL